MAIGVLIRRVVKPGQSARLLLPHIIELRALAVRQPGYISGETLFSLDHPEECLVISRWTTLEHWQRWKASAEESIKRHEEADADSERPAAI